MLAAAEEQLIAATSNAMPVTHEQWSDWLDNNEDEFRTRMQTEFQERKQRSIRIRARPGLTECAPRLQPIKATAPLQTKWAAILAGRIGWHGLRTTTGGQMFFLVYHDYQAYYGA